MQSSFSNPKEISAEVISIDLLNKPHSKDRMLFLMSMNRHADRRAHERVADSARAYLVDKDAAITGCGVVDFSFSGAKLKIPYGAVIPEQMTLCIPSKGIDRQIDVVWREGDKIGVVFSFSALDLEEVQQALPRSQSKPIPVSELRKLAEGAVSWEPVPSRINASRLREAAVTFAKMDRWRDAGAKIKSTMERQIRVMIDDARAIIVDKSFRDSAGGNAAAPMEPLTADIELLRPLVEIRPQQDAALDPWGDACGPSVISDRNVLMSDGEEMSEAEQHFFLAHAADAHQRLLNRGRRNLPVYLFAAALAFICMPAALFFMSRGDSISAAAIQNADRAAPGKISIADAGPVSMGGPSIPVPAIVGSKTDGAAPLSDGPPLVADDTSARVASVAVPANPSAPQRDGLVHPLQSVEQMAISSGGKATDSIARWLQDAPLAPCSDAAHLVETQTFQATMPAGLCTTMDP